MKKEREFVYAKAQKNSDFQLRIELMTLLGLELML